jgi:hypothetical protein
MLTNWKTTLIGALLAIVVAIQPLITTGSIEWSQVILAALIALLGFLAKDFDVTGGSRKAMMIIVLMMIGGISFGQGKNSFFKPVTKDAFVISGQKAVSPSLWLFRPAVSLTAVQLTWNKTTKEFDSQPFSSAGLGVAYQHYIEVNGLPYNNFGFNALLLFGAPTAIDPASMSVVGTITALKFISIGGGYNFGNKVPLILTGISYSF